jgi:hypothetical protein
MKEKQTTETEVAEQRNNNDNNRIWTEKWLIQGDPEVTQPINPLLQKISPLC